MKKSGIDGAIKMEGAPRNGDELIQLGSVTRLAGGLSCSSTPAAISIASSGSPIQV